MASAFVFERRSPISSSEASGRPKSTRRAPGREAAPGAQLHVRLGPRLERARGRVPEVLALRPLDADPPIARLLALQAPGGGRIGGWGGGLCGALRIVVIGHRLGVAARAGRSRRGAVAMRGAVWNPHEVACMLGARWLDARRSVPRIRVWHGHGGTQTSSRSGAAVRGSVSVPSPAGRPGRPAGAAARMAAWARSTGYSTRRHSTVPSTVSSTIAQARGSPSRGWPTLPGLRMQRRSSSRSCAPSPARSTSTSAVLVAEGEREVGVADEAVGASRRRPGSGAPPGPRGGTPRADRAGCHGRA